jgi:hypothetical protein
MYYFPAGLIRVVLVLHRLRHPLALAAVNREHKLGTPRFNFLDSITRLTYKTGLLRTLP